MLALLNSRNCIYVDGRKLQSKVSSFQPGKDGEATPSGREAKRANRIAEHHGKVKIQTDHLVSTHTPHLG
jgi:hypothetical protein